ncbi:5-formyltetrahydrofolate cyclo-ligase [Methanobacterium aggregans]|uniref:5-formyltetrahydrofolate cyclo-ligase n=1 Tax=Methanobacterium aggregans TaxID=1615586 RepID=UPI001AE72135|nr:5-formyltetrahydrofolate cyclo-ligase [Methanobacterium aggregans]MBP2046951.1 5-formyltetrahydrofolate cyclo-ligase [Methanobacterium aggregans]
MELKTKDEMRNGIWKILGSMEESQSRKRLYGRIPDFPGSKKAAKLLRSTDEWSNANVIFSSPDTAQSLVREYALLDKKILLMASPNLEHGYLLINPKSAEGNEKIASTKEGAFKFGEEIEEFPRVDMVVEGSVAVDLEGGRLGKGKGYGDREISHLFSEKAIDNMTPIVTTVHEVQIVDKVPEEVHDRQINMVVTPEMIIRI